MVDPSPQPSPATPAVARPLRILLAEDNPTVRMMVLTVLTKMNHSVVAVENGARAVETAKHEAFDLILIDMHTPVIGGPAAMQQIHANPSIRRKTPIIAITADTDVGNHEAYLRAGASLVMTKPIEWRRLAAEMIRLTSGPGDAPVASVPMPPLLDSALMESTLNNIDHAVFAEMIDSFRIDLKTYADEITSAVDGGDTKAAKQTAHALRGAAGQMGAARLSAVAKTIETAARDNAFSPALMAQLAETTDATRDALKTWREQPRGRTR